MMTAIDERRPELGRLDLVPDAARWLAMPLAELYAIYCRLRDAALLPANNEPIRAPTSNRTMRKLGEWWEPPAKTWDDRQSPNPDWAAIAKTGLPAKAS